MPGIRQFNGYFAGIIRVPFKTFALYAYTGSALWVLAFFGIGYVFGNQWEFIFSIVEQSLEYLIVVIVITIIVFQFIKRRKVGK